MTFLFESDEDDVEARTLHEAARGLGRRLTKDEVGGRPKPPEERRTRSWRLSTDHPLGREIRGVSEAWRIVSSSFSGVVAAAETRAPASRPQLLTLLSLSHSLAFNLRSTLPTPCILLSSLSPYPSYYSHTVSYVMPPRRRNKDEAEDDSEEELQALPSDDEEEEEEYGYPLISFSSVVRLVCSGSRY